MVLFGIGERRPMIPVCVTPVLPLALLCYEARVVGQVLPWFGPDDEPSFALDMTQIWQPSGFPSKWVA